MGGVGRVGVGDLTRWGGWVDVGDLTWWEGGGCGRPNLVGGVGGWVWET